MSEKFGSAIEIGLYPREESEKKKWDNINDLVTVNESQYSFGKEDIQKQFFDSLNLNPKDKNKYKFYREEWYRRAKEFDPGDAPLAVVIELVSTCNLGCTMCYTITDEFQDSVVRPEFWGGLRIKPIQIEFWADGQYRLHDRFVWERELGEKFWNVRRLYP